VERFLTLHHVVDTTSEALKVALFGILDKYNLSISRIRGQGYDGASNMRGEFNGLQKKILYENPRAFYVHCFAHRLQFVIVSVSSCCSAIHDFFEYVSLIVITTSASCVEMNNRFGESTIQILTCFSCLDPKNNFSRFDIDSLVRGAQIYDADFSTSDFAQIRQQLQTYILQVRRHVAFSTCTDIASLASKMVETKKHKVFPLVYRLIELPLILPVSIASVERAFSAMKIIRTNLRNKMADEWFNHLMVCYIEREIFKELDDSTILRRFQGMKTRKMNLPRSLPS
jgi:hypothetical protein